MTGSAMRAVLVRPPAAGARLGEMPTPVAGPGEVEVDVLECGVCGTDRDIAEGKYGRAPDGATELILGHENLGRIHRVAPGTPGFAVGDLVVATVRRGCGRCRFCRAGRSDFCETGGFTERGISGRHGYWCARYVERPEYLVRVPESLRDHAVLLEPLSVVEKAIHEGQRIVARYEPTTGFPRERPYRALVTGTGAIGMLAALVLGLEEYSVTVIDRHDDTTPAARLLAEAGIPHVNVAGGLAALGEARYDLIVEASGSATLDFELLDYLGPNAGLVLTGLPTADPAGVPVPAGRLFRAMVLGNQAIVGSVNANREYFERGIHHLLAMRRRWPGLAPRLITERRPLAEFADAISAKAGATIKTVLTVAEGDG